MGPRCCRRRCSSSRLISWWWARTRTYLIWRADTVYHLGDIEHACELVGQAVPDIAAARSVRNHRRLVDIHGRLTKHRNSAVQALDEQVRSLIA